MYHIIKSYTLFWKKNRIISISHLYIYKAELEFMNHIYNISDHGSHKVWLPNPCSSNSDCPSPNSECNTYASIMRCKCNPDFFKSIGTRSCVEGKLKPHATPKSRSCFTLHFRPKDGRRSVFVRSRKRGPGCTCRHTPVEPQFVVMHKLSFLYKLCWIWQILDCT